MPTTWLISDTHYGHDNIIGYCARPYPTVAEMNYDMARRWNGRVAVDDLVYHFGDFAMGDPERWPEYRAQLQGRIILVRGNHDRHLERVIDRMGYEDVLTDAIVEIDDVRCWLNHYPLVEDEQDREYRGRRNLFRPPAPGEYDLALCGHIHDRWTVSHGCVNVGVDRWGFSPIRVADALAARDAVA